MEIQNASTTPSVSNELRNAYTVRWESRDITSQSGEIYYRKSEVIALVWTSLPITFIFKSRKEVSMSEVFALFSCSVGYFTYALCIVCRLGCLSYNCARYLPFSLYIWNMCPIFRVIDGQYIVKVLRGIVKHVHKVVPLRFVKITHKIPFITI